MKINGFCRFWAARRKNSLLQVIGGDRFDDKQRFKIRQQRMSDIKERQVSQMVEYRAAQNLSYEEAAFLEDATTRLGQLEGLALNDDLHEYHLYGYDHRDGLKIAPSLLDMQEYCGSTYIRYAALHSKLEIIDGLWATVKPEITYRETEDRIRFCQQGIPDDKGGHSKYLKAIFGDEDAPEGSSRRISLSLVISDLGGPEKFGITEAKLEEFERAPLMYAQSPARRRSGSQLAEAIDAEGSLKEQAQRGPIVFCGTVFSRLGYDA